MRADSIQAAASELASRALLKKSRYNNMRDFVAGLLPAATTLMSYYTPTGFPALHEQPDLQAADLVYVQSAPGCPAMFQALNPVGICNIGACDGQLVLKFKDAGFTVRSNSDANDIVAAVPYEALDAEHVTQLLLFFVSALGALGGAISTEGLSRWLRSKLSEVVGPPVSVVSSCVSSWLLTDSAMSLVVHQGVGSELTVPEQASAQQLYNFFMFYMTSQDVMKGLVRMVTQQLEAWLAVVHTVCPDHMVDGLASRVRSLRLKAGALRTADVSTAHIDVLFASSAELNSSLRYESTYDLTTLGAKWGAFKDVMQLVTRHLKVRSNLHSSLAEAALHRGWQLHAQHIMSMVHIEDKAGQSHGHEAAF